jgi:LytS/YehU family sensor histidine kinase
MLSLALLLSSILRITNEWKLAQAAKNAMEKEKNTAEIALLKNQINPHFLFNTLNGIYAMSLKKSDHTPSAIIKLSNMMRYVLYESEHDSVPLTKEIKYIEAYIELQQLRINEKNIVHFEVTGDSDSFFIAPMLLITFVENAFKYGICADTPTETLMKIECFNNTLHFYSRNSKFIKHNNLHKGIGIANVKRRLELFYEGDYMLDIKETENQFIVQLEIKLFSYC